MQLLTDWTQTYGQVFVWHFGTQAVLVVTDPEEVTRFCNNSNKQDNLPKWAKTYLVLEPVSFAMFCVVLSMHMLTSNITAKAAMYVLWLYCMPLMWNFDHVLTESATLLNNWYTRL